MADEQILQNIQASIQTLQKNSDDTLEIVHFLKDNMVSKEDLKNDLDLLELRLDTKLEKFEQRADNKLTSVRSDIMSHIDGFAKANVRLDTEITSMRSAYNRLDQGLHDLAKHVQFKLSF